MSAPPDYLFEEKLWKDLESRMYQKEKGKPFLGFTSWLLLLLLTTITTGLAGYFYVKNDKAEERIADLEQQFQGYQQQSTIDTIVKKQITIIYDTTIYNHTIINPSQQDKSWEKANQAGVLNQLNPSMPLNSGHKKLGFKNATTFSATEASNPQKKLTQEDNPSFSLNHETLLTEKKPAPFQHTGLNIPALNTIPFLPEFNRSLLATQSEKTIDFSPVPAGKNKSQKNIDFFLLKLKPSSFSLSASAGTLAILNFGGKRKTNRLGNIRAEIGYGNRFSFVFGLEVINEKFKMEFKDPGEKMDGFPEAPPNNQEDVLHEIYGKFRYLQIPFGIKYSLMPNSRFHPYIGLGLISQKAIKSSLSYEYLAMMEMYHLSLDNVLPNTYKVEDFWATIGLQYELTKRWSLLLEGTSQVKLKQGIYKYENLQLLKWNAGIQYHF